MYNTKYINTYVVCSLVIFSTFFYVVQASAQSGIASVYSGERTANGEYAHAHRMTAAHRSLPFGTKVKVINRHNGHSVVVRINDRGPFVHGRVIDVTPAAAGALGFSGLTAVTLLVVKD